MSNIKNTSDSSLLVRVQTCMVILENSVVFPQNIENQSTSRPSDTTLGQIPKGYSILSLGHHVHCSYIYNYH